LARAVFWREQRERLAVKFAHSHSAAFCEFMACRHDSHQFFTEKRLTDQGFAARWKEADAKVELASFQIGLDVRNGHLATFDPDSRMLGAEPCDDFRDNTGVHSLHNSNAKQSLLEAVQFAQGGLRLVQLTQNLPRVREQRFACGSQLYAASDAIEQLQVELVFQLPNLM